MAVLRNRAGSLGFALYRYKYAVFNEGLRDLLAHLVEIRDVQLAIGRASREVEEDIGWVENMVRYGDEQLENFKDDRAIIEDAGMSWRSLAFLKIAGFLAVEKVKREKDRMLQKKGVLSSPVLKAFNERISEIQSWNQKDALAEINLEEALVDAGLEHLMQADQIPMTTQMAPSLQMDGLHPRVIEVAGTLFGQGHLHAAILSTCIDLVTRVRDRAGTPRDARTGVALDGDKLMNAAFLGEQPLLKVSDNPDEQTGFGWMFKGMVMGLRNAKAHRLEATTDPQRALEWLALASVLYRLLDDSTLLQNLPLREVSGEG